MAFQTYDRIRETSTTSGTGNLTLSALNNSYSRFSDVYDTNVRFPYVVVDGTAAFETGIGYLNGSGELVRETVLDNSDQTTSKISLSSDTKAVFVGHPSNLAVTLNSNPTEDYVDDKFAVYSSGSGDYEWSLKSFENVALNSGSFIDNSVVYISSGNLTTSAAFQFLSGSQLVNLSGDLAVSGNIQGSSKEFSITHPFKEGYKLRHGSLEGPEHGIYFRERVVFNKFNFKQEIKMPEYFTHLTENNYDIFITSNDGSKISHNVTNDVINLKKCWWNAFSDSKVSVMVLASRKDTGFILEEFVG
jgi:hypothetical protein